MDGIRKDAISAAGEVDPVTAGVVNRVIVDLIIRSVGMNAGGVGTGVIHVMDDVVGDADVAVADVDAVACAVGDCAVLESDPEPLSTIPSGPGGDQPLPPTFVNWVM